MAHYGMVIDLRRCVGCQACTASCKVENGTRPGIFWNRVLDREEGQYPDVQRSFLPMPCMHCANAPCEKVCPTGATYRRDDGIVLVDYDKCIGCRYCQSVCPYGARFFSESADGYYGAVLTPDEEVRYAGHQLGVAEKCTFCVHRLDQGEDPACVSTCGPRARVFGDLDDPDSEVSKLIRGRGGEPLSPELGTAPSVYYLAR